MSDLLKIMESIEATNWDSLEHDLCSCSDCGWAGPVTSCESYTETESWEMPHIKYTVHICPVCALHGENGDIENFHSSISALFQTAYEDTKTKNANSADTDVGELLNSIQAVIRYCHLDDDGCVSVKLEFLEQIEQALQGSTAEKVCKWQAFTYRPSTDYMSRVHSETGYSSSCGSTKAYLYSYCPHCGGKVELEKEQ